jgi:hypothetical protein
VSRYVVEKKPSVIDQYAFRALRQQGRKWGIIARTGDFGRMPGGNQSEVEVQGELDVIHSSQLE